ncbi:MAG TPA: CHAD domain-containing protein [Thermoanaerobaculia bacterium]|nr:CHAD domain-containing protein [Thermoanaerobaculia bacterium]
MSETLWGLRARSLAKARKAFLRGEPNGLHDLRVALRRVEATASAFGKKSIEKRSRKMVQSLSPLRQLEVDRALLARIRDLGRIPEGVADNLDAQWSSQYAEGYAEAARAAKGTRMRDLEKTLRRLDGPSLEKAVARLETDRRRLEEKLLPPNEDASDRRLHRYRIAVKRARYLAEDLAALGVEKLGDRIEREKGLQDALGHWNDVHLFRERLKEIRGRSEEEGAVSLAADLDPVIAALEETLASVRREAFAVAGRFARVLPFLERSA